MEIKGYTLHGDYYLADKVITNTTWEEAYKMKEEITLPNGKKVVARTLSKIELETIPIEEREIDDKWYWLETLNQGSYERPKADSSAWIVSYDFFNKHSIDYSDWQGGTRLGFRNPF